jgi:hypothetical protein
MLFRTIPNVLNCNSLEQSFSLNIYFRPKYF